MDAYLSGFFAIAGAVVGGLFTYLAARVGHRWNEATRRIAEMGEQVAAYHALEQAYMLELHHADPELGAPGTIQTRMRDRVQQLPGFVRPEMTANRARRVVARFS